MTSDYDDTGDYESQNEAAQGGLTFYGKERGLVITQSGYDDQALKMQLHIRQDLGGHTYGDRGSFTLSALGRSFVRNPVGYVPQTKWSSTILVNGQGIETRGIYGKAPQPARIIYHQDNDLATFTGGDATYAYNTEWYWTARESLDDHPSVPSRLITVERPGTFSPVNLTWNDFRHPDNQLVEAYGNISFYDRAHWQFGGTWKEGVQTRQVNDLSQYYRQAGLVRGDHSYLLVVDDLHKITGGLETEYEWMAQIAQDLVEMDPADFHHPNLNAAMDFVLREQATAPAGAEGISLGTRRLLFRVLSAEGSQPDGLASIIQDSYGKVANRLVVKRKSERPRFRILMYPYIEGDDIPSLTSSGATHTLQWSSGQVDTIAFNLSTKSVANMNVEFTEILLKRDGEVLVETKVEDSDLVPFRW